MIASRRGHARATGRVRTHARTMMRPSRRGLALFLFCVAFALSGSAQRALSDDTTQSAATGTTSIVVGLSDAMLTLPIPPGYCAIAPTAPDLASSFAAVEAAFGKGTCLLAWFVECGALASVREGTASSASLFADYGVYVTSINEDGVFQQFPAMTRATFVRRVADSLPPIDRDRLSLTVAKVQSMHDKTDSGIRMATREIGLLGSDTQAYYLATAIDLTLNDEERAVMGVAATTLVHRVAVSTIVYGGTDGSATLEMLEARALAATLALIEVNPGGDGSDRRFAFDANRLLLIGFAIGLLFIAVGVVNWAWRSWCRRHGLRP